MIKIYEGYESIEQYIVAAAMMILEGDEDQTLLDPQSEEVVLNVR